MLLIDERKIKYILNLIPETHLRMKKSLKMLKKLLKSVWDK